MTKRPAADLYVLAGADLAIASVTEQSVRFEGVAVSPGVYVAQGGQRVRITEAHLDLIAARLGAVPLRDLHEERVEATVGAVEGARVADARVVFEGTVGIQPHATIVRRFPETVAFSVGFRFRAADLDSGRDGVADMPMDFHIDHVALVGRGQDPDARLTRLLNEYDPERVRHMDERDAERLRQERDTALQAADKAKADLAEAKADLGMAKKEVEKLELAAEKAEEAAEEARLELSGAKSHFAQSVIKLELKADKEVDLDKRREELLGMNLGDLDKLRLDLAAKAAGDSAPAGGRGPATRSDAGGAGGGATKRLDLEAFEKLPVHDSVRLALIREVI